MARTVRFLYWFLEGFAASAEPRCFVIAPLGATGAGDRHAQ
jgi:hypothetical protein